MEITIPPFDLKSIAPIILITIAGIVVLMTDVFFKKLPKETLGYLSFLAVLITGLITFSQTGSPVYSFSNTFVVDNFSIFFNYIFLMSTAIVILMSVNYLHQEGVNFGEYYTLILFATMGMMLMAGAADLITVFLGLEIMSISLYVLAGFKRDRLESNESALKYFLLGAFATCFLLYGMALLYGATGTTNIKEIATFITNNHAFSSPMIIMGASLLIIGFGFKMASVPFHKWVPDVYEGAPTSVTAFMSAGPKAAAFAVFLRVFLISLPGLEQKWSVILWVLAALTMTVGNVVAIAQTNIKRMLAYSSIAHAGYVLMAIVTASSLGTASILFYLLVYVFMNLGAFAVIIILGKRGEENLRIDDYNGLGYKHPIMAIVMSIFMFSLAGIPPFAGFMGKFYIFSAAIKSGYIILAIIGVINSVISVYYYLRVTVVMYMKQPTREFAPLSLSPYIILALVITIWGTIHLGIFPSSIIELAQKSVLLQ
ncbi:MAG: NADH-quinone oxidoreductase subunit N [Candidatus Scalindua sp. AMX11]|nr:MAG: NADH-quinone oxidoreductase subunit N [Candidatus Scalindua sp.]NOG82759.1 NADH-quinone oxidoreductase subunit N [Planctomycetota bacterium]RZV95328.1 MAG: NADH-quinone oxidoreductase subunit N [Candidatus Scalindua sp. SCAELEC01]TDE66190.1 MAG: NADH-quinone oxidoreductase subunit N [Candidatus Scalindua sp. AMX11]GJQ57808.1 MAG: NADH-quinone oxidoreductase subunit N [Candidatus Scalindua sp.]